MPCGRSSERAFTRISKWAGRDLNLLAAWRYRPQNSLFSVVYQDSREVMGYDDVKEKIMELPIKEIAKMAITAKKA